MKVLWLCNIMLPAVAEHFHRESSNKEGWLSGLLTAVLSHGDSNGIELAVAFPVAERLPYRLQATGTGTVDAADGEKARENYDGTDSDGYRSTHRGIRISCGENAQTSFTAYDFVEDTTRPDLYDPALEQELREICVRISHRMWCIASERNTPTPWQCAEHSREKTGYWSEYRDCAQCMRSAILRICRKRL